MANTRRAKRARKKPLDETTGNRTPSSLTLARRKRAAADNGNVAKPAPLSRAPSVHTDSYAASKERRAEGKALRDSLPRQAQGVWKRDKGAVDPIAILRESDDGRMAQLIPIRYGRMLASPFTFYRGAASVMAADLDRTPVTGIRVQACGDCHLLNFGGFATPERNILFDINDFDETLPAPWEWDVKRLGASFVLAARSNGFAESKCRDVAIECARSYREHIDEYSKMSPLEVWYSRISHLDVIEHAPTESLKDRMRERIEKASSSATMDLIYPELTGMVGGHVRIHDTPPLIFHPQPEELSPEHFHEMLVANLQVYRESLADDRRVLLDRYRLVDGAIKVVGIGSVGTMCMVILLMSAANDPLFLQWKEARASVLEPYAGKSVYPHHGQRVVTGQRLMQPATDMFMGWLTGTGPLQKQGYVRQLRDAKIKPLVETFDAKTMSYYAELCGWVLARAHAKAGDPLLISGYLGSEENFDNAMGRFAVSYADQTERDHAALKAAVKAGKIDVMVEE